MGYDLHIHRAAWRLEASDTPISAEEWRRYASRAPDLHEDEPFERYTNDGRVEEVEVYNLDFGDGVCALYLDEGAILVRGVRDSRPIKRLFEIARDLDARLEGDDGEYYGPDGEPVAEPKRGLLSRLRRRA